MSSGQPLPASPYGELGRRTKIWGAGLGAGLGAAYGTLLWRLLGPPGVAAGLYLTGLSAWAGWRTAAEVARDQLERGPPTLTGYLVAGVVEGLQAGLRVGLAFAASAALALLGLLLSGVLPRGPLQEVASLGLVGLLVGMTLCGLVGAVTGLVGGLLGGLGAYVLFRQHLRPR